MAQVHGNGPITWKAERDDDGYRTYRVTYLVEATVTESPAAVMAASGLPTIGSPFNISGYSGTDLWCWCRPEMNVSIAQEREGDPATFYKVETVFSNKTEHGKSHRCNNTQITDPLLEPMKVGGSFAKAQWEARYDKDGVRLVSSANEPFTGSAVTFDYVRPTVHVEQNVASLGLSTFAGMVNTVNASPLWGVPKRCIKLTNAPWERKVCGSCNFYYTRSFDFEVDYFNHDKDGNPIGFDKEIYDSGSHCLRGQWITDKTDPYYGAYKLLSSIYGTSPSTILTSKQADFMAYKDMNNECARVVLDGYGRPANVPLRYESPPGTWNSATSASPASTILKYYRESNFLMLGIPTSF